MTRTIAWLKDGLIMTFLLATAMAAMPPAARGDDTAASKTEQGYYLGAQVHGPNNKDRLTNPYMHTLPLEYVVEEAWTGKDGQFPASRVISLVAPMVVRQNDPGGPKYQEALGYTFVLNSPKYPGLCKMDDGTLVLTMTAALAEGSAVVTAGSAWDAIFAAEKKRTDVILYSKDNGMSWSQPRRIPGYRTTPMNLGGKKLMIRGWNSKIDVPEAFRFWFSDDAGQTWSDEEVVPPLPDGSPVLTDVAMNYPIEGDTIRFMLFLPRHNSRPTGAWTIIRRYNFVKHTWGETTFFAPEYRSTEGSMIRASNGDLVAVLRSGRNGSLRHLTAGEASSPRGRPTTARPGPNLPLILYTVTCTVVC